MTLLKQIRSLKEWLREFVFPFSSDQWLAVLRIGLGLQIVLYTLSLRRDWNFLFASNARGLISRDLGEAILNAESSLIPRLGWLVASGSNFGLSEATILSLVWAVLLCAGCLLILGFLSRTSAALAWFLHLCAAKSVVSLSYGMDNFATIGLFYLMLSPFPDRYSIDWRLQKIHRQDPHLLGFFRRVLQLHLCLIYFFGGLTKFLGEGWWNGDSMWRALTRPPFNIIAPEILVRWRLLLPSLGILICLIEVGYPFFIWHKRTRMIGLACVCAMHIAIGVTMGLYLFSLVMIVLNLAAFGPNISFAPSSALPATSRNNKVPRHAV